MKYFFKCNKCGSVKRADILFDEKMPEGYECGCGGYMTQDYSGKFKSLFLKTPEIFKSQSIYHPKDYTDGGTSTDLEALGY